ncbi:MAG: filamentous hemagglutinin N-terminal domain-containing protein [Cyanobacteria bacterium]|nr:filamentous hemagglutinin N-terminal domain-containing protein [Cyanobacteria bacterium GSL.Bin21]
MIKKLVFFPLILLALPVHAQVKPDASLPNPSSITRQNQTTIINGGTKKGNNLFHSFQKFSIAPNHTALFQNGTNVTNILTRITGGSISKIEGTLQTQGTANLFLVNPNGIIFGPNAQLNIGGSFLATTAKQINFADGRRFSSRNPSQPTLTISTPIGLGFGTQPGKILVQGQGHNLASPTLSPVSGTNHDPEIHSQQDLALIGGDIKLQGGIIQAKAIELGSVAEGSITFDMDNWDFNYGDANQFQTIQLENRALLNASGFPLANIHLQGEDISFSGGSVALIQNSTEFTTGDITVDATESLFISGTDPEAEILGSIRNETVGSGDSGHIIINSPTVTLTEGGQINALTFGAGNIGSIELNTTDSVQILGTSPRTPSAFSGISLSTFGEGNTGDLTLLTGRLKVADGATISLTTFGASSTGNIVIQASQLVEISGIEPSIMLPSLISNATLGQGSSGNLTLATNKLVVERGARIGTVTVAQGNAGDVNINADSVFVRGISPSPSFLPSQIQSSTDLLNPSLQQIFPIPPTPSGQSGNLLINAFSINLTDQALISARNEGIGNAGNITLNAENLSLRNQSQINTSTQSGVGGNIEINTNTVIGGGNSDILANAQQGPGGDITINSNQVFGFAVRQETNNSNLEQFQTNKINDIAAISAVNPELNGRIRFEENQLIPSFELTPIDLAPPLSLRLNACFNRSNQATRFKVLNIQNNQPSPNRITPSFEPDDQIVEGNTLISHPDDENLYLVRRCQFY